MTAEEKLRVILLTHGGAELALERLLTLDCAEIVGVFVETPTPRRRTLREKLRRSIRYDGFATTLAKPLRKAVRRLRASQSADKGASDRHERLLEIARASGVPVHFVSNYHAPESIALMRATRPDLGVVYGTNILKESVFGLPRLGSINLHQGLVPFHRGGPVLFWELYNGEPEVGVTVHMVAANVDAGEIILQETIPLEYDYAHGLDYESFIASFRERKMRELSARLVAEAVRMIAEGTAIMRPQDLSLGRRYRLPTKREKDELRRRLRVGRRQASSERLVAREANNGGNE